MSCTFRKWFEFLEISRRAQEPARGLDALQQNLTYFVTLLQHQIRCQRLYFPIRGIKGVRKIATFLERPWTNFFKPYWCSQESPNLQYNIHLLRGSSSEFKNFLDFDNGLELFSFTLFCRQHGNLNGVIHVSRLQTIGKLSMHLHCLTIPQNIFAIGIANETQSNMARFNETF